MIDNNYPIIEVLVKDKVQFLKIRETLTRIGIGNDKTKTLTQSVHIYHHKGRYFICHFKELFLLNGFPANLTNRDILRRDAIAKLLVQWDLISLKYPDKLSKEAEKYIPQIKILPYAEKTNWTLCQKFNIKKH